uniref:Uncharacterized protein n=1 Tax=Rhizophora mucronata TaxID=61149 RepID=A0A2P2P1Q4_RHIMU
MLSCNNPNSSRLSAKITGFQHSKPQNYLKHGVSVPNLYIKSYSYMNACYLAKVISF